MFNKILVALDDSPMSQPIFEAALFLAQSAGAELKLLSVVAPDSVDFQQAMPQSSTEASHTNSQGKLTCFLGHFEVAEQTLFKQYMSRASAVGVPANFASCFGVPGSTICEVARDWKADLIVIGRRGLSETTEQAIGSVSGYVVHHTPCAVHIIQRPDHIDISVPSSDQVEDLRVLEPH